MGALPRDFYEVQESQRRRSLPLFFAVLGFHFVAIGIIGLALVGTLGFLFAGAAVRSSGFWLRFALADAGAAGLIAVLHFMDARRNGARYILRRLQAETPDPADRYHKQLLNTIDEIRIAAGLPRVNAYVLPSFAVNSLALIEANGTPAVAVTEGLLAEGTRDELQAVAAHEIAHIARGDAFYLTLVCSLANLFERLREALEPEREDAAVGLGGGRIAGAGGGTAAGGPSALLYVAVSLSALVMHLLSALVSREREILADAAAVELCRAPESLARAICKAHVKNSFVGDFSQTYTPLFIVPPDARDIPDNFAGRVFNTHPPLAKRLDILAAMAHKSRRTIIDDVLAGERARSRARGVLHSHDEIRRQFELFPGAEHGAEPVAAGSGGGPGISNGGVANGGVTGDAATIAAANGDSPAYADVSLSGGAIAGVDGALAPPRVTPLDSEDSRIWLMASAVPHKWKGPFTLGELVSEPRFSLLMKVRNAQERVEGRAREFAAIRAALRNVAVKKPIDPARQNLCPRCRAPLAETFYEGVAVRACPGCEGKLVGMSVIDRIVARREVAFSEELRAKAREFEERVLLNPLKKRAAAATGVDSLMCPSCGYRMVSRPYSYQYFIPVDKCLSCSKIWFDADELEILQALIESRIPPKLT